MHIHGDHKTRRYFVINHTLKPPTSPDCAWQQLGIILIKKDGLLPLEPPDAYGAICYTNVYSHRHHLFFCSLYAAAGITGANMSSG